MYAAVVLSVLIVAATAQPEPRRCCVEPYYTFTQETVLTGLQGGGLLTEFIQVKGAYDSIVKKLGFSVNEHISNGTKERFRFIGDYDEAKGYLIYKHGDEVACLLLHLEVGFPYNCVPDDATYIGSSTLGDRALRVANWFTEEKGEFEDKQNVYTFKEEECIDVAVQSRTFDPKTGDEISIAQSSYNDYNLGICDPDKYFKVPEECEDGRALKVKSMPEKFAKMPNPVKKPLF